MKLFRFNTMLAKQWLTTVQYCTLRQKVGFGVSLEFPSTF